MSDEVKDFLLRLAEEVAPPTRAPHRMIRRARRAVAGTVVISLVVLAAAGFGAFTGVQALAGLQRAQPAVNPPASRNGLIAFVGSGSSPESPDGRPAVYTVRPDGTGLHELASTVGLPVLGSGEGGLSWSPNGREIAFIGRSRSHDGDALYIVRADGQNLRRVLGYGSHIPRGEAAVFPYRLASPSWSPNGDKIVVQRWISEPEVTSPALMMVNSDGTDPHDVAASRFVAQSPEWSLTGDAIAFWGEPMKSPRKCGLWTMRSDGTQGRRILIAPPAAGLCSATTPAGGINPLAWSPDGRAMLVATPGGALARIAVAGGSRQPIDVVWGPTPAATGGCVGCGGGLFGAAWAPDGSRVVFSASAGGAPPRLLVLTVNRSLGRWSASPLRIPGAPSAQEYPSWRALATSIPTPAPSPSSLPTAALATPTPSLTSATAPAPSGAKQIALGQLQMVSRSTGWGVGSWGFGHGAGEAVVRSADGGRTWNEVLPAVATIFALNADDAWAAAPAERAGAGWNSKTRIVAYRTSDGGSTWRFSSLKTVGVGVDVAQLDFVNPQDGWLVVGNREGDITRLFRTVDAGVRWTRAARPLVPSGLERCAGSVSFVDSSTGYVTPDCWTQPISAAGFANLLQVTHDGGGHWQPVGLRPPVGGSQACAEGCFLTAPRFFGQDGWLSLMGGPRVVVYVTRNGGATWVVEPTPVRGSRPGDVQLDAVDASDAFLSVLGADPALYSTRDGGATWSRLSTNLEAFGNASTALWVDFVSSQFGAATATGGGRFLLLSTTDGGTTWKSIIPELARRR